MYDMEDFGDTVSTIPGIVDMGKLVKIIDNGIEEDSLKGDVGKCQGRWDSMMFDGLLKAMG